MDSCEDNIQNIITQLKNIDFEIPITQEGTEPFPEFLRSKFDEYISSCKEHLLIHVDQTITHGSDTKNVVLDRIEQLSDALCETVDLYFKGKLFESTNCFNTALDSLLFNEI